MGILGIATSLILTGCGGGGGAGVSSGSTAPQTFAVAAAVRQKGLAGYQISGPISGTATVNGQSLSVAGNAQFSVFAATVPTEFDNQPAFEGMETLNGSVTIASQTYTVANSDSFFVATNGTPLGDMSPTSFCVVTSYSSPPDSAAIGSTGEFMTLNCYTDGTRTTLVGTESERYVVSSGPYAETAIVSIIDTAVNTANEVVSVTQVDFEADAAGAFMLLDVRESGTYEGIYMTFTIQ